MRIFCWAPVSNCLFVFCVCGDFLQSSRSKLVCCTSDPANSTLMRHVTHRSPNHCHIYRQPAVAAQECKNRTLVGHALSGKADFSIGSLGNRQLTQKIKYHRFNFLYCVWPTRVRFFHSWAGAGCIYKCDSLIYSPFLCRLRDVEKRRERERKRKRERERARARERESEREREREIRSTS